MVSPPIPDNYVKLKFHLLKAYSLLKGIIRWLRGLSPLWTRQPHSHQGMSHRCISMSADAVATDESILFLFLPSPSPAFLEMFNPIRINFNIFILIFSSCSRCLRARNIRQYYCYARHFPSLFLAAPQHPRSIDWQDSHLQRHTAVLCYRTGRYPVSPFLLERPPMRLIPPQPTSPSGGLPIHSANAIPVIV